MSNMTPYRRLALAVLKQAARDAEAGSVDARRFLEEPGSRLALWCGLLTLQEESVKHFLTPMGQRYLTKLSQTSAPEPPIPVALGYLSIHREAQERP